VIEPRELFFRGGSTVAATHKQSLQKPFAQEYFMKNETISQDLTFGWRWDNIEAVIEYLEVMPDRGTALITVTAERLKEGAIEAFGRLFARKPLGRLLVSGSYRSGFSSGCERFL
jgi:hypothetical protein